MSVFMFVFVIRDTRRRHVRRRGGYGALAAKEMSKSRMGRRSKSFVLSFVLFLECLPCMYSGALGHSSTSGGTCQGRKAKRSGLGSLASWRQGCWMMFAVEGGSSPNLRLNHTSFSLLSGTVRPKLLVILFPAPQCRRTLKPKGCAVRQPSRPLTVPMTSATDPLECIYRRAAGISRRAANH
jgi:hypothetical protein